MAEEHVLVVEHADAGVVAAAGEPEEVLGVVVAQDGHLRRGDGEKGGLGEGVVLGGEVGRDGGAGGGGEVPFRHQAHLAHEEGEVVGRRGPADVLAGGRAALEVGERLDGGAVEAGLAAGVLGAEGGEEVVAEVLEEDEAAGAVGAEHLGGAEAAGAEPGGDGEEGAHVEAALGGHVHEDGALEAAAEPLVAAGGGVAGERGPLGPSPALAGEEGADLLGAGHAAASMAAASQSQPGPVAERRARRASSAPGRRSRVSVRRRAGSAGPEALGPFDDGDRGGEGVLEAELGDLGRRREAVEVGVPELERPVLGAEVVGLHQGVARRGDVLGAAEGGEAGGDQRPREGALAGAEAAREAHQVAGGEMRGDGAGEPLGGCGVGERQG